MTVEVCLPGDTSPAGNSDRDNDGVADEVDVAPASPNLCRDTDGNGCDDCTHTGAEGSGGDPADDGTSADGDGICNASDDTVGDGVTDADAMRPDTSSAAVVDLATECSVSQLVACAGPLGSSEPCQDQGEYVASVAQTAQGFLIQGRCLDRRRQREIRRPRLRDPSSDGYCR